MDKNAVRKADNARLSPKSPHTNHTQFHPFPRMGSHLHYLGLAQFRHWTPSAHQFLNWTKWVGGLVAPLVLGRGNRCQKEEEEDKEEEEKVGLQLPLVGLWS